MLDRVNHSCPNCGSHGSSLGVFEFIRYHDGDYYFQATCLDCNLVGMAVASITNLREILLAANSQPSPYWPPNLGISNWRVVAPYHSDRTRQRHAAKLRQAIRLCGIPSGTLLNAVWDERGPTMWDKLRKLPFWYNILGTLWARTLFTEDTQGNTLRVPFDASIATIWGFEPLNRADEEVHWRCLATPPTSNGETDA